MEGNKKHLWSAKKSVTLSLAVTLLLSVVLLALLFFAPTLFSRFSAMTRTADTSYFALLITFYACCPPAVAALILLTRLLLNIRAGETFTRENVRLLRYLSWCCFFVIPVTTAGGFCYVSLFVIAAAAAFMGLILRVLKNVLAAAAEIKGENDLTV